MTGQVSGYAQRAGEGVNLIGAGRANAAAQALRRSLESAGLLRRVTRHPSFDP
jgi:hypothetical protein